MSVHDPIRTTQSIQTSHPVQMDHLLQRQKPEPLFFEHTHSPVGHIGVLLIHGFTGSTNEMRPLASHLHQVGYTVIAPLLNGHGLTPEDMQCTTWVDWYASAREGYRQLKKAGCEHIVVIGLSMGGLLAVKVAQHAPVAGIVTLCAPYKVQDPRMSMARYVQNIMPYKKRARRKASHIEKHLHVMDRMPVACVVSLDELMENVKAVFPYLNQPALIIQAGQDETVHPSSGQAIYDAIGSEEKKLLFFENSSHIITLDHEQPVLHEKVTGFIQQILDQGSTSKTQHVEHREE